MSLVQLFWIEGAENSGPALSRAYSAGPDFQHPVVNSSCRSNLGSKTTSAHMCLHVPHVPTGTVMFFVREG